MAKHKYDGPWSHFQISTMPFPPIKPNPPAGFPKATLVIPDGTTGKVEAGSMIGGKAVTSGTASPDGKTLELFVDEPGNTRHYFGHLLSEFNSGTAQEVIVLVGRFKDYPHAIPMKDFDRGVRPLAQNEGDWVLTKP